MSVTRADGSFHPTTPFSEDGARGRGLWRYQKVTSGGSPVASDAQRRRGAVPLLGPEQVVAVLRETHLAVRGHRPRDEAGHEIAGPVLEGVGALLRPGSARGAGAGPASRAGSGRPARRRGGTPRPLSGAAPRSRRPPPRAPATGVSPAAIAASSGSRPESIAETTRAEGGRRLGSFSRQARIVRSTAGSRSGTIAEGSIGRSSRCLRVELREPLALEGAPPRDELVDQEAEGVDVAADGDLAPLQLLGRHVGRASPSARRRPRPPPRGPRGRSP